jgi:hypothetical protein
MQHRPPPEGGGLAVESSSGPEFNTTRVVRKMLRLTSHPRYEVGVGLRSCSGLERLSRGLPNDYQPSKDLREDLVKIHIGRGQALTVHHSR